MSKTSLIEIKYCQGALKDPQGKEGLTHFVEHCLLKAKVRDMNFIEVCASCGATINARTSMDYVIVEIKILNDRMLNLLENILKFYPKVITEMELSNSYICGERKIIFEEITTRGGSNRILGDKEKLSNMNQKDIVFILSQILNSKVEIKVTNVNQVDIEHMYFFLENIFKTYNKDFCKDDISYTLAENNNLNVYKRISCNRCNLIIMKSDCKQKFIVMSIIVSSMARKHLVAISTILIQYLLEVNPRITIQINTELGCLNVFMKGKKDDLLIGCKKIFSLDAKKAVKYLKHLKNRPQHVLNDIHFQMVHQRGDVENYKENSWVSCLDDFWYIGEKKISVVTNILEENEIIKNIPERKNDFRMNQECYDLSDLTIKASQNEYVIVWKTPNYFSKEKYISHVVWSLLGGITGELYKSFVLNEKLCYGFTFYPRELIDSGYSIFYLQTNNKVNPIRYQELFQEVLETLVDTIDEEKLNQTKISLIGVKKDEKNSLNEFVSLATMNLYEDRVYDDYCDEIQKVSLMDVKEYIKKYLLKVPI